jgi:endonuclease G
MARRSSDSGGFIFKTGLFAILAGLAYWIFNQSAGKGPAGPEGPEPQEQPSGDRPVVKPAPTVPRELLPAGGQGELVEHTYFTLSYSEAAEQAEWVVYELTRQRLELPWAQRPNTFRPDPEVETESATPRDYNGSGYDKGHLCAAADMAFDPLAIDETFFMSNISPQDPAFNGGIWRELEELSRDWARRSQVLYMVTGPVLRQPPVSRIGFSKVVVPAMYYKVLLAPQQRRAIAFLMPNAVSTRPVMEYACTVDVVEQQTGLDFFPQLLRGPDEALEASIDKGAWPVDRKKYQKRVTEWNDR